MLSLHMPGTSGKEIAEKKRILLALCRLRSKCEKNSLFNDLAFCCCFFFLIKCVIKPFFFCPQASESEN